MIAARVFVNLWRASEFARHDHQSVVQHAAIRKVIQQCRKCFVKGRTAVLATNHIDATIVSPADVFVRTVVVPQIELATVFSVVRPEHVDVLSACFGQSPRQQKALTVFVSPVAIPQSRRFLFKVERASHVRRRNQIMERR